MKKTHYDRKALLDRLEKKYIKKVQLHAFKRESDLLKHQLSAMRGSSVSKLEDESPELLEMPDYRLTFS